METVQSPVPVYNSTVAVTSKKRKVWVFKYTFKITILKILSFIKPCFGTIYDKQLLLPEIWSLAKHGVALIVLQSQKCYIIAPQIVLKTIIMKTAHTRQGNISISLSALFFFFKQYGMFRQPLLCSFLNKLLCCILKQKTSFATWN